jgi:hypothetical protein
MEASSFWLMGNRADVTAKAVKHPILPTAETGGSFREGPIRKIISSPVKDLANPSVGMEETKHRLEWADAGAWPEKSPCARQAPFEKHTEQNAIMKTKSACILAAGLSLIGVVSGRAQTTFTQITNGPIVSDLGGFATFVWGDFHNSGFLDLFVCNENGTLTNLYYRNDGAGAFTKISQGDPVADADYHVGSAAADYNNDGYLDLAVGAGGSNSPIPTRMRIYHNNGDGTFTPGGGGAVTNLLGYFAMCYWADYDNDGFLDLCVEEDGAGQVILIHNNGDGTFATKQLVTGVNIWGFAWADYDNDGFEDLLVITYDYNGVNTLYHNNRDGTFTRILTNAIATDRWSAGAYGEDWGDFDNDGFLDLFVTSGDGTPNRLYHNNGDGTFTSITNGPTGSRPPGTHSLACSWGDYDNDGYLDLFVTSYNGPNMLFRNNGDGTFTQILSGAPVNETNSLVYCNSCGWVDYDNDGFLDLFVTRGFGTGISNLLYHNDGNSNGWLKVKLEGKASNRSAIGAKVHVHATIGGKTFRQMREISNGGPRSVRPLVAHFGLGDATNADLVRIEWPSGIVQTLTNVAPKQILTVVEHQQPGAPAAPQFTSVARLPGGAAELSVAGSTGLLYVLEGSTDLGNWTKLGAKSNATGVVAFTDTKAANYASRFYRVSIP